MSTENPFNNISSGTDTGLPIAEEQPSEIEKPRALSREESEKLEKLENELSGTELNLSGEEKVPIAPLTVRDWGTFGELLEYIKNLWAEMNKKSNDAKNDEDLPDESRRSFLKISLLAGVTGLAGCAVHIGRQGVEVSTGRGIYSNNMPQNMPDMLRNENQANMQREFSISQATEKLRLESSDLMEKIENDTALSQREKAIRLQGIKERLQIQENSLRQADNLEDSLARQNIENMRRYIYGQYNYYGYSPRYPSPFFGYGRNYGYNPYVNGNYYNYRRQLQEEKIKNAVTFHGWTQQHTPDPTQRQVHDNTLRQYIQKLRRRW